MVQSWAERLLSWCVGVSKLPGDKDRAGLATGGRRWIIVDTGEYWWILMDTGEHW